MSRPRDEAVAKRQAEQAAKLAEYIRVVVAAAPPLTPDQRAQLRALLGPELSA